MQGTDIIIPWRTFETSFAHICDWFVILAHCLDIIKTDLEMEIMRCKFDI